MNNYFEYDWADQYNGQITFAVDGITEPHPFHVVYTRNTNARNYAEQFLG